MLNRHIYLKNKIDQLISEQIAMLMDHMSTGSPPDYASYMRIVGKIDGLRLALDLCNEAEMLMKRDT